MAAAKSVAYIPRKGKLLKNTLETSEIEYFILDNMQTLKNIATKCLRELGVAIVGHWTK